MQNNYNWLHKIKRSDKAGVSGTNLSDYKSDLNCLVLAVHFCCSYSQRFVSCPFIFICTNLYLNYKMLHRFVGYQQLPQASLGPRNYGYISVLHRDLTSKLAVTRSSTPIRLADRSLIHSCTTKNLHTTSIVGCRCTICGGYR